MSMLENTLLFKTICRLGLADLQALINPSVFEIIHAQNISINSRELAKILCEIYLIDDILSDRVKRTRLIEALNQEEISRLAEQLKISDVQTNKLWDSISKFKFSSEVERNILYDFFEISDFLENHPNLDNEETEAKASSTVITGSYSLFPHQQRLIQEVQKTLENKNRVLIHMPTGAGKTRTCMNIICDHLKNSGLSNDKLVIWLADTEELCEQAVEEFTRAWSFLGSSSITLHRLYSSYNLDLEEIQNGFLVAGLAKIRSKFDQSQEEKLNFSRRCSLIIFDEAHKILAPTYSELVQLISVVSNAQIIGLSATPGRSTHNTEKNNKLAEFFKYQKVGLEIKGYDNPIQYLQAEGYLSKVEYHNIPNHVNYFTKEDLANIENQNEIPASILEKLSTDSQRNLYLINLILEKVSRGKKIIVFACSVAHAEGLYALLKYKNVAAGMVSSKIKQVLRAETIKNYKNNTIKVIINFGVLSTGFDDPETNVAIIARPTKSLTLYSQMVGRASRGIKVGGNLSSEVYTVIDDSIPSFNSLAKAFQHWEKDWGSKEEILT